MSPRSGWPSQAFAASCGISTARSWWWTRRIASASGGTTSGRSTWRSAGSCPTCRARVCSHAPPPRPPSSATRSWPGWGSRPTRRRSCAASPGRTWPCAPSRWRAAATGTAWWTLSSMRSSRRPGTGAGRPSCTRPRASWRTRSPLASRRAAGARRSTMPASTAPGASACSASSSRAGARSWSRPTPSAWASIAPTCAPSSTWARPPPSRRITRRSAAPGATARTRWACS